MAIDTTAITEKIQAKSSWVAPVREEMHHVIVGQEMLVDRPPHRPPDKRTHPVGRCSWIGEDPHCKCAGGVYQQQLSSLPVHAGPATGRFAGHPYLQSARW